MYLDSFVADRKAVRDQLVLMILAGRDTVRNFLCSDFVIVTNLIQTAALLTFTIYLLALNPRVLAKLREDVVAHCGADHPPTLDTLKQMKYRKYSTASPRPSITEISPLVRAVIDESLRIFPPVPGSRRIASQDTILPPSSPSQPTYFVPSGTDLAWINILTQRRPDLWGEDADDFVPERWFDKKTLTALNERPGMYMPFAAGVRTVRWNPVHYR